MVSYVNYVNYQVSIGMDKYVAHWEAAELEAMAEGRLIVYGAGLVKRARIW